LLSHTLKQPKSWILAHTDYQPGQGELEELNELVEKFQSGVPLPYLLEYWEFFGRRFNVTHDVLIPRPETELLVEMALQHAKKLDRPLLLDIGTGSGAIAVSLAAEIPLAHVIGTDISLEALKIARENAKNLNQDRVLFLQADLLPPLSQAPDIICANLPYIPTQTLQTLDIYGKEPSLALDGGADGLDMIQNFLQQAKNQLAKQGMILLEIEAGQGVSAMAVSRSAFPRADIQLHQDLQGRDRVIEIIQY